MLKSAPVEPKTKTLTKPKKPVGRPRTRNPGKYPTNTNLPYLEEVERYGRLGMRIKDLADIYGYTYTEFFQVLSDYPTLRQAYQKGKASGVSRATRYLFRHIKKGDKAALFFFLERMAGFIPKSEMQVETTNKPPVELSIGQQRAMAQAVLSSIQDVSVVDEAEVVPESRQLGVSAVERVLESGEKALAADMGELAVMSEVKAGVATQARRAAQQRAYDEGKLARELEDSPQQKAGYAAVKRALELSDADPAKAKG